MIHPFGTYGVISRTWAYDICLSKQMVINYTFFCFVFLNSACFLVSVFSWLLINAVHYPWSTALGASCKFWYAIFFYLYLFQNNFLSPLMIFYFICNLFGGILFSFQICDIFPDIFPFLITILIPLWLRNMFVCFNYLKFVVTILWNRIGCGLSW